MSSGIFGEKEGNGAGAAQQRDGLAEARRPGRELAVAAVQHYPRGEPDGALRQGQKPVVGTERRGQRGEPGGPEGTEAVAAVVRCLPRFRGLVLPLWGNFAQIRARLRRQDQSPSL